ncbi:MAG: GNAT family N-acetyltransferase [Bacteroidetes bacterium]|jgi:RimJ/RimL family protein N-acetyltransferase|nr:GNAT family N-acetyltransferase [Bacteroidota bacterium]MBK9543370.1 GNAT family N-acetyltransferase [Bacteroidota bacterium]MBP6401665.1 GNAT family N-acetyltransferase [Bacteroidia bacterium]MBP6648471.1 GNAT family N-acetyltransferase [Bacteroidia bacterium]
MNQEFENFSIRPIEQEDSEKYFQFIEKNRERIARYFPRTLSRNQDVEASGLFIAELIALREKKEFASFLIIDKISQQIIGTVFLKDFDWNVGKVEIGFFIDKDFVNKGIISKSVSFVIDYAFKELKLNKIFMRVSEDNLASRRVAEKNNFEIEGKLRKDFKTSDGELIDVIYYGVLNEGRGTIGLKRDEGR